MIRRTESLKRRVTPLKGTRMQQRKNESVLKEKKQMHSERKRDSSGILLAVDFQEASDSSDHSFLVKVLGKI